MQPNMKRRNFIKTGAGAIAGIYSIHSATSLKAAEDRKSYRILGADKGSVAIIDESGKVEWKYANKAEAHDLHLLKNGNILLPVSRTKIVEVTPDKSIAWSYEAKYKPGYQGGIEIHAFQPLPDGRVMVAESGSYSTASLLFSRRSSKACRIAVSNEARSAGLTSGNPCTNLRSRSRRDPLSSFCQGCLNVASVSAANSASSVSSVALTTVSPPKEDPAASSALGVGVTFLRSVFARCILK